jgi:hypothetical protein|tara:strand:- start:2890 stop:3069 length:180 start_codon:yes stop_codon:yes gene_type:complete
MPIITDTDNFVYDNDFGPEENFTKWRIANHEERSAWGDKLYTLEESREIFNSLFKNILK